MSVWRIFQILSGSLINCLIKVMRGEGPNMSLLKVTSTYQDSLRIFWWELMPLTDTSNMWERKWVVQNRLWYLTFVLLTRANQKRFLRTKLYCRSVLRTRANQKPLSSISILRRKATHNVSIKTWTKKNTQRMRQSMKNLWLRMIQFSRSQAIIT